MMLAFAMGAALAAPPAPAAPPSPAIGFDLPPSAIVRRVDPHILPLVPLPPRNLDTRDLNAPEAEWKIVDGGPALLVGAMGGRRSGMPKLAHVALDWSF
jgi:hypothetical protein